MDIGFEKTYLMQNNLNISQSEVISTYVYKVGLTIGAGDFPFATAIGLFNSIINFILLILVNYSAKKINNNSLW
jgi:putative aldouronate transport system permease protein